LTSLALAPSRIVLAVEPLTGLVFQPSVVVCRGPFGAPIEPYGLMLAPLPMTRAVASVGTAVTLVETTLSLCDEAWMEPRL
jgi:hypothetical protein